MIESTVVGYAPDTSAVSSTVSAPAPAATPAPGQRAYTPPRGLMISGFDRQYVPQQGDITFDDLVTAANPLQHLPGVGMIYRAATGTTLKPPLAILGSIAIGAATAGPFGVLGTVFMNLAQTIVGLGPAVPGHVLQAADTPASSEAPMQTTGVGDGTVTYADGRTGLPGWTEGELTNFDMTQGQPAAGADAETRRGLALAAYNRLVAAYGGLDA